MILGSIRIWWFCSPSDGMFFKEHDSKIGGCDIMLRPFFFINNGIVQFAERKHDLEINKPINFGNKYWPELINALHKVISPKR